MTAEGGGREGEDALEVGKERGVVEGAAGGRRVGVPAGEGKSGGEGEPVAVHLEVGAAVRRDQ